MGESESTSTSVAIRRPGNHVTLRCLLRLALALCAGLFAHGAQAGTPPLTIGNYQVISSVRVSRLEFEFTVKADVTNSGPDANSVLATVTSTSPDTVIVRNSLFFGDVAAGATRTSTNTFTIRQNRVASFDPSALTWQVMVNAPVFTITITSPADGLLTNANSVRVTGTTSSPASSVRINTSSANVSGKGFSADILLNEGITTLTAVAVFPAGQVATTSVNVTRDTQAPRLAIDSPIAGVTVSSSPITVTGTMNDTVVGTVNAEQGTVTVNGRSATIVNRTFIATEVPLTPGANTITAAGRDRAGNVGTASVAITYDNSVTARVAAVSGDHQTALIGTVLPEPLVVLATNEKGVPAAGKRVIFKVIQNDGIVTGGGRTARSVIVSTGADGKAQVIFRLGTRVGAGNNQVLASVVGFPGEAMFCASATAAPAAMLVMDKGNRQTGVPGEPLPRPFVVIVVDSGNNRLANIPITFTSTAGGGSFEGLSVRTVPTDSDGRALVTLTLGSDAGIENNRVEATFPGNTGLPVGFTASGMVTGDVAQTKISGVILDNSDVPVPGATIRILGTSRTAVSNAQGQFTVASVPVGTLRMTVDGSTVTRPGSWVNLDYTITTVAGQDNSIGMPVRLLQIDTVHGINVTPTQGGTITLPDYPGYSLTIAPGSVTFPGGSQTGFVTATIVHNDKTPEVPNFGQQPRFIVSINPKGCIFNPPAQMCIPNLDGHPPGQKTEMYSFDDSLNQFVSIGTGTVSMDGTQICSDLGSGVIRGGWHCGGNPASVAAGIVSQVSVDKSELVLCANESGVIIATGSPTPPHASPFDWQQPSALNFSISTNGSVSTATITGSTPGEYTVKVRYRCKSAQWSAYKDVKVIVAKFEFVTPAGDPVAAPVDSGDGQNEFTFSSASTGILNLALKAKVIPSGIANKIKDHVVFEVDPIGNSSLSWDASNPGGKPIAQGDNLIAMAKYTDLPDTNAAYGTKTAHIRCNGQLAGTASYEAFFLKSASNNPGGFFFSDPNWFYYWKDGNVCGVPSDAKYTSDPLYGRYVHSFLFGLFGGYLALGPYAPETNSGPEIYTHKATGVSITVTGVGKGIACVAETVAHELNHKANRDRLGNQADMDSDGIADSDEATLEGLNTLINDADTYNLGIAIPGSGYNRYGDDEVRCRKKELNTGVTIFPNLDWANPGSQSKNKFGP